MIFRASKELVDQIAEDAELCLAVRWDLNVGVEIDVLNDRLKGLFRHLAELDDDFVRTEARTGRVRKLLFDCLAEKVDNVVEAVPGHQTLPSREVPAGEC
jgi:hypothetical protein